MTRLAEDEKSKYRKHANKETGVDGISDEMLNNIDKDTLPILQKDTKGRLVSDNGYIYKYDPFTPKSRSYAFKPSFAGRQYILGIFNGEIIFSDGRWFVYD